MTEFCNWREFQFFSKPNLFENQLSASIDISSDVHLEISSVIRKIRHLFVRLL